MSTSPQPIVAVFASADRSSRSPAVVDVVRSLSMAGYGCVEVSTIEALGAQLPSQGWTVSVVCVPDDEEEATAAWGFCRDLRKQEQMAVPALVLVSGAKMTDLAGRHEQFDDFMFTPFHPAELELRVGHLLWRTGQAPGPETLEIGPLSLNLENYQANVSNRPLDLTYMEYELLKFLALSPGKVFSREVLLNRVWGYEYYGGARTVDVHVRRLRAKFGEEYAHLIQTVRSVGYKLDHLR